MVLSMEGVACRNLEGDKHENSVFISRHLRRSDLGWRAGRGSKLSVVLDLHRRQLELRVLDLQTMHGQRQWDWRVLSRKRHV